MEFVNTIVVNAVVRTRRAKSDTSICQQRRFRMRATWLCWPKTQSVFIIAVKSCQLAAWQLDLSRDGVFGQHNASYRLIRLWLDDSDSLYDHFTSAHAASAEAAFEKECYAYHAALESLDSERHPSSQKENGQRSFCPFWKCAWNY